MLYRWETSRGAGCLQKVIAANFQGTLQCDAYVAYGSFVKNHARKITLAGCWAHARRNFYEAREQAPQRCGWILHQIAHLYRIEENLRRSQAGPNKRVAVRVSQSRPIYQRLRSAEPFLLTKFLDVWHQSSRLLPLSFTPEIREPSLHSRYRASRVPTPHPSSAETNPFRRGRIVEAAGATPLCVPTDFPCCVHVHSHACYHHYPGGTPRSVSLCCRGTATFSVIVADRFPRRPFEGCSVFTHVAARMAR